MPKSPDKFVAYPRELSLSARGLAGLTLMLLLAQFGVNLALPPKAFASGPGLGCSNTAFPSVCHPVGPDGFARTPSGFSATVDGEVCRWNNGATSSTCSVAGVSEPVVTMRDTPTPPAEYNRGTSSDTVSSNNSVKVQEQSGAAGDCVFDLSAVSSGSGTERLRPGESDAANNVYCDVGGVLRRGALSGVPLPASPAGVTCEIPFGYAIGGSATLRVGESNDLGKCKIDEYGRVRFDPFTPVPRGTPSPLDPNATPQIQMARPTQDLPKPDIKNRILRQDPTPRPVVSQDAFGGRTINGQSVPLGWGERTAVNICRTIRRLGIHCTVLNERFMPEISPPTY